MKKNYNLDIVTKTLTISRDFANAIADPSSE